MEKTRTCVIYSCFCVLLLSWNTERVNLRDRGRSRGEKNRWIITDVRVIISNTTLSPLLSIYIVSPYFDDTRTIFFLTPIRIVRHRFEIDSIVRRPPSPRITSFVRGKVSRGCMQYQFALDRGRDASYSETAILPRPRWFSRGCFRWKLKSEAGRRITRISPPAVEKGMKPWIQKQHKSQKWTSWYCVSYWHSVKSITVPMTMKNFIIHHNSKRYNFEKKVHITIHLISF